MQYRISKIARILGISSQAIHFYEKKGVLKVTKDEVTGYRTFQSLDIGTLLRCRTYAQFGLNLNDAAALINDYDVKETHAHLLAQEGYLEREIERMERSLYRLRELNDIIARCEKEAGQCRLQTHPGIYRIDYHHNGVLNEDPKLLKLFSEWSQMVPLSFVSLHVPLQSLLQTDQDYYVGMGVMEDDAAFLGIRESAFVKHVPSGSAVRSILRIQGQADIIGIREFQYMLDYAHHKGLKPINDLFTRMVIVTQRSSECVRFYELFLPVL